MRYPLKYATAGQIIPLGPFLDSSDGDTVLSGLTILNTDIKLHKAGATSLVSKNSGGGTYMAHGKYYATADATDTNTYGPMDVSVHVAGALHVELKCIVMNEAAYNKLYSSTGFNDLSEATVQQQVLDAMNNDALTEAYAADGATVTVSKALYEILSLLGEFSKSGTTVTYKKRDGSTTAFTSTLDDSSRPTSHTRST